MMSHLNLDLHLTILRYELKCIKKKCKRKTFSVPFSNISRLCHYIFKHTVYCLFNDVVEKNVSPVDHKEYNHYL